MVNGLQDLPPESQISVFVANHASYLDSFVVAASIPRDFSFIAKGELRNSIFTGPVLKRVGSEFVERIDRRKGVSDAEDIAGARQRTQSLFFFPEGTFTRVSGLQAFHMGAFITAAKANMQVIPVAIRGTRSMLPPDTWVPRRGRITVTIGQPITPAVVPAGKTGDSWATAVKLKETAHRHIQSYCGEVDLSSKPGRPGQI